MLDNRLEGQQLANFRVDKFLGRGGMALVYRGWDLTLERSVAIKVIAAPFQKDPGYTARFVQEGRAMARWRHENIVQIYYASQEEDLNYMVMEYVEGSDLEKWLSPYKKDNIAVPQEEILRIGKAVANALDYAHTHNIIHRDVKPANILMAEDGRILLTDFGLALDLQKGSSGEAFGSPKYIAPEQARNSTEVVPQSDLYSLGIILYEMLTGRVPFEGDSATGLAIQHMNEPPPSPRTINPSLNEATEETLLKCLRKSPDNRYQNGQHMMAALESALNEEMDGSGANLVGSRVFSNVPIADIVSAHLSPPLLLEDEAPARSSLLAFVSAVGLHRPDKMWPIAGIGIAIVFFCLIGIFWATLGADRIVQNNTEAGGGSNETLVDSGSGNWQNGDFTDQATLSESEQGDHLGALAPTVTLDGVLNNNPTIPGAEGDSSGNHLIFIYNAGGFYAWNPGNSDIAIQQLTFEAIDNDGNSIGLSFEASRWAGYYSAIQGGHCDRLEILDVPKEPPGQCQGYNAVLISEKNDTDIFWLAQENISQFRVSNGGREIARCDITAGQCEVVIL